MNYRLLLEQVQSHVQTLYRSNARPALLYHNLTHTEGVVSAATQIADHYQLSDRDFFVVLAAAWFHDSGYLDGANEHEEKSMQEAAAFLSGLQVNPGDIEAVKQCILATKMPQNPHNLLEQILCDADLFHLGTDAFSERSKQMRKEYNASHHKDISKEEWRNKTIGLMQQHRYYTDYARLLQDEKKQQNLTALLSKQRDAAAPVQEKEGLAVQETGNT